MLSSFSKRASMRRQSTAKRASMASTTTSTSADTYSVPSSPLAILLSGGRAVRMEGFLKEKSGMAFGWKTKFVCLEEGRIRISKNEDDDDSSMSTGSGQPNGKRTSEMINLVDLENLKYSKRGSSQFSLVTPQKTLKLKAHTGEEAEAWVQHVLQEMKNQAQLLNKCAALLLKNKQQRGVEQLYRQSLRMWTLSNGEMHETVAAALEELGQYLVSIDREADANIYLKRASIIRNQLESGPRGIPAGRSASKRRGSNDGLVELQMWLELQSRAEESADVLERTEQLRKREKELIQLMSSQHETKIEELRNKAIQAEERARQAEVELKKMREERSSLVESGPVKAVKRLSKRISKRLSKTLSSSRSRDESDAESDDSSRTTDRSNSEMSIDSLDHEVLKERSASQSSKRKSKSVALAAMPAESFLDEIEEEEQVLRRDSSKEEVSSISEEEEATSLRRKKKQLSQGKNVQGSLQRTKGKISKGACYLVHSQNSEGTLYIHWSLTPVEDAIGQFIPADSVTIPKFKFSHNEGRSEVVRGFQGPGGLKKYFQGLVHFLKMAHEHKSVQVVISGGSIPVSVYLWRDEIVQRVSIGSAFSIVGASAVTVFGEKNDSYEGVVKLPLQQFCVVGCKGGHSMQLGH